MSIKFCSLSSGSSGNCIYVAGDHGGILIDCGISGKEVFNGLKNLGVCTSTIKAILVTHEHSDHTKGIGIVSRKLNIPIYANNNTWENIDNIGTVKSENIKVFETGKEFCIDDITIQPYRTPHDSAESVGFCFHVGNRKVSLATDLGHFSDTVRESIKGSDMVMLESNHDIEMLKVGKYPYFLKRRVMGELGHLSNEAAGHALYELLNTGVKEVLLGHLSKENNFPELAYQTVKNILEEKSVKIGRDISIDLAPRNGISKFYNVG